MDQSEATNVAKPNRLPMIPSVNANVKTTKPVVKQITPTIKIETTNATYDGHASTPNVLLKCSCELQPLMKVSAAARQLSNSCALPMLPIYIGSALLMCFGSHGTSPRSNITTNPIHADNAKPACSPSPHPSGLNTRGCALGSAICMLLCESALNTQPPPHRVFPGAPQRIHSNIHRACSASGPLNVQTSILAAIAGGVIPHEKNLTSHNNSQELEASSHVVRHLWAIGVHARASDRPMQSRCNSNCFLHAARTAVNVAIPHSVLVTSTNHAKASLRPPAGADPAPTVSWSTWSEHMVTMPHTTYARPHHRCMVGYLLRNGLSNCMVANTSMDAPKVT